MAVVEISRIQVRRGQENQTGVPLLESGEFGWASDTEKLYIGLRRVDGGARDANIRILTENDLRNVFASTNNLTGLNTGSVYTYRDGTGISNSTTNYTLLTSPTVVDEEFVRTVQNKLDDIVNVKDFGAEGNGINDDTGPLQAAITNLFLADRHDDLSISSTGTRKILYIPGGDYKISQTLYLPPNAKVVGEGIGVTRLFQSSSNQHFFQTIGSTSTTNNYALYPNINSAGADNILIEKMSLITTSTSSQSFISLDCASHSSVRDVRFQGNTATTSTSYVGVEIRGLGIISSDHVTIENCQFDSLYYGISGSSYARSPYINNNHFIQLNRGIVLENSVSNAEVTFATISNNYFDMIDREAIYVSSDNPTTATNHISIGNKFYNVGNYRDSFGFASSTGTSIVKFATLGNSSRNDYYHRYSYEISSVDSTTSTFYPLVEGISAIESDAVRSNVISAGSSATVILLPISGSPQYVTVKYHMYNYAVGTDLVDRRGNLDIYISSGSNPTVAFTDNYNYFTNDSSSYSNLITNLNAAKQFYQIKLWNKLPTGSGASFSAILAPWPAYTGTTATGTYTNVTLVGGGTNYQIGDTVTILGDYIGGLSPANDLTLTVQTVNLVNGAILTFTTNAATANSVTTSTTFTLSTSTNSRVGGGGGNLYLDHQLSIMTV